MEEGGGFFLGELGQNIFNWGEGGGGYVVGVVVECKYLYEEVYYPLFSGAFLDPGLVGLGWYGVLGYCVLNLLSIVADAVTYFCKMNPCFEKTGNTTSCWDFRAQHIRP